MKINTSQTVKQTVVYTIGNNLYINVTDHCTLRCAFCPKFNGSLAVKGHDLLLHHLPTSAEIIAAIGNNPQAYQQVVFCGYGEPTLRLAVVLEVAQYVKEHGGQTRLNTDGLANLVHKRNVLADMHGLIDAVSVSMNAATPEIYNLHCRPQLPGSFEAMISFLTRAPYFINDVTATAINGLEGVNIDDCRNITHWLGVKFRVRNLDELG